MTKKKLAAVLVTTGLLSAACGAVITAVWPDGPSSAESGYLAHVRRAAPEVGKQDDDTLISLGRGLCYAVAQNGHVASVETPPGVRASDVMAVIDAATRDLCPELRRQVTDYLSRSPG
jgi:hypothetical protein